MLVVEIQEKNKVGKSLENSEVNIYTYINSEYIYIYKNIYIYIYIYIVYFLFQSLVGVQHLYSW